MTEQRMLSEIRRFFPKADVCEDYEGPGFIVPYLVFYPINDTGEIFCMGQGGTRHQALKMTYDSISQTADAFNAAAKRYV